MVHGSVYIKRWWTRACPKRYVACYDFFALVLVFVVRVDDGEFIRGEKGLDGEAGHVQSLRGRKAWHVLPFSTMAFSPSSLICM